MFGAIIILFFLPWLDRSKVRSAKFRPLYQGFFWIFVIDCFVLGYVGAKPAEGVLVVVGQWATLYYFAHILVFIPLLGMFEKTKPVPDSIASAVTKAAKTEEA